MVFNENIIIYKIDKRLGFCIMKACMKVHLIMIYMSETTMPVKFILKKTDNCNYARVHYSQDTNIGHPNPVSSN